MSLKFKIENLEEAEEGHRPFYKQHEAGGFVLDAEGIDDPAELKRAKDREKLGRKEAERRAAEAEEALAAERSRSGDIAALEKDWQESTAKMVAQVEAKHQAALAEIDSTLKPQIATLTRDLHTILVDGVARGIAERVCLPGCADVLLPHLLPRLGVDVVDGQRVTVVLDKKGKPTQRTIAQLTAEFVSNAAFAPMIRGGQGSGSGAGGLKRGNGPDSGSISRAAFEAMSPADRAEHMRAGRTIHD